MYCLLKAGKKHGAFQIECEHLDILHTKLKYKYQWCVAMLLKALKKCYYKKGYGI